MEPRKPRPPILPGTTLTAIIRNDAELIHCQSLPQYRSVHIQLTEEQRRQMALLWTHSSGGSGFYESISQVFIEPAPPGDEG